MKKILLVLVGLAVIGNLSAQMNAFMRKGSNCLENKMEKRPYENIVERVYINNDYCDYYLVRGSSWYSLQPGVNVVETLDTKSDHQKAQYEMGTSAMNTTNYTSLPGRFVTKLDTNIVYAIPCAATYAVASSVNSSSSIHSYNFEIPNGDTIFAVRGGSVCLAPKGYEHNTTTIYHIDGTFTFYMHARMIIAPGEMVEVGQPIAIACEGKPLHIYIWYLDKQKVKDKADFPYSPVIPRWQSGDTQVKLQKEKTLLTATIRDELIMQDMSKAEKKRYLKQRK